MEKRFVINDSNLTGRNDFYEIEVDPPLVFVNNNNTPNTPDELATVTGRLVAVCVCEMGNNLTRVVLHKAERLEGGKGLRYGGGPSRIMDGFTTMQTAMDHLGYKRVTSLENQYSGPLDSTVYEVWPKNGEWILTHNADFARSVYEDQGPGNVLAFKQVQYDPSMGQKNSAILPD